MVISTCMICFPVPGNVVGVVKKDLRLLLLIAQIYTFSQFGDLLEKTCWHLFYFESFIKIQVLGVFSSSFTQVFTSFMSLLCTAPGSIDNSESLVIYSSSIWCIPKAYYVRERQACISIDPYFVIISSLLGNQITQVLWNRVHHRWNSAKMKS